jgi:chaperonin GroES
MAAKTKAIKTTKRIKGKLDPTAGYVVIKPVEAEKKTSSGIYLPESSGDEPTVGQVIAVGPDQITDSGQKKKSPVKVKDFVVYKKHAGNKVILDTEEFLFARFDDILAVIKE